MSRSYRHSARWNHDEDEAVMRDAWRGRRREIVKHRASSYGDPDAMMAADPFSPAFHPMLARSESFAHG